MAQTLSILAFVVFWINFIASSLNIGFSLKAKNYNEPSVNLRGTKEKLLEINPNYFLEKEIENPKELRNLINDALGLPIVIINASTFLFILLLTFSFFVTEDECCSKEGICDCGTFICCSCCLDCKCDLSNLKFSSSNSSSDSNNGLGALGLLVIALVIMIFVGLFFAVNACGKILSRMLCIILLFLMNATLAVLSLFLGLNKFCILLAVFSGFAALSNLILLILVICFICDCHITNNDNNKVDNPNNQLQMVHQQTPTSQKLIEVQDQYEKPYYEQEYPDYKDFKQETIGKPVTPNYSDQNQDNNYNSETPTSYDAPPPEYQNNDNNNQTNIPYPTPE